MQLKTEQYSDVVNESLKGRVILVLLLGFPGNRICVTSDPAPPSQ